MPDSYLTHAADAVALERAGRYAEAAEAYRQAALIEAIGDATTSYYAGRAAEMLARLPAKGGNDVPSA